MTSRDPSSAQVRAIPRLDPHESTIEGVRPIDRVIHVDRRGFLLETLREDDSGVSGNRFTMSYTSLTVPGEFRDVDRWHVHRKQVDRFIVVLGEMSLALFDARPDSASNGHLNVLALHGASWRRPVAGEPATASTSLVPIPTGVYHSLGNLGEEPFLYQNFPTELYNPADEGRVPFTDVIVPALGAPFSWSLVLRPSP